MKVLHIITGLGNGGAEGVLYRLVTHDKSNEHIVVSLMDEGKYGPLLIKKGISVHCLNMSQGKPSIKSIADLFKLIKMSKADVVQTWMSHADLLGGLISKLLRHENIIWNIRHSKLEYKASNLKTNAVILTCMALSKGIPKKIVCCSEKTFQDYAGRGYPKKKMTVISNGYEFDKFNVDPDSRKKIRTELGINEDTHLLGMIARYDPNKNHVGLLHALKIVKETNDNFKAVLVGRELNNQNKELVSKIRELDLCDQIILLDQRNDIPAIMNALDLNILSSKSGEGFPNVLAEAMACGTLCIATDMGDSSIIIDDYGWVVEADNDELLANTILEALELKKQSTEWIKMKALARKHITDNFSISLMIKKYNEVWNSL